MLGKSNRYSATIPENRDISSILQPLQAPNMLRIKKCKILYKTRPCNVVALGRPKNRSNKPDYVVRRLLGH